MHRLSFIISFLVLLTFGLQGQSPHGKAFKMDCAQCHNSGTWTFSATSKFRHESTGFGLEGQHKIIQCKACHTDLAFKKTSSACITCHQDMHNQTVGNDCARCHNTQSWVVENIAKMHDKTSFPLVGVHKTVNCTECHKADSKIRFNPIGQTCVDCHNKDFKNAKSPNHVKLNISTDCASCHNTVTPQWNTTKFANHDAVYPLTGAHAAIAQDCKKCHTTSNYADAPRECAGCHAANFKAAKNPDHVKLNLSTDCASCHSTNPGWAPAKFTVHDAIYPLTGAHKAIANTCNACHKGGVYNNTPTECMACHQANYAKTTNPNHKELNIATDCASCHSTNPGWSPAKYLPHQNFFPLTGAHSNVSCKECHKNGIFKNTPKDCYSCHSENYKKSSNPNHVTLALSTDCISCHTTVPGWRPSTFNHNQFYPLTGGHATVANDCAKCHTNSSTKNTPKECAACHTANFQSAKNPDHVLAGFSKDCASCHSTNPGWKPSNFNHNAVYPLTGAHASVASNCTACHKTGDVKSTPTDCAACHTANFQSAKNPNHSLAGFSKDCASCHSTNPGWKPSNFNHNAVYPLTGAHASVASNCTACHKTGDVKTTPTNCNACHNAAYQAAQNPNHAVSGFSTDCASCHTTNPGWRPSTFNHNNIYPLTGAHANIATNCTLCHKGGVFKNTPKDCNGCHNAAYQASKNPNHVTAKFSTDCASCHTTTPGWRPANFDHNAFYPLTGAHSTIKNNCTACHINGQFSNTPKDCAACHTTNFQSAKNPDHVLAGLSKDCASCHSTNPGWKPSSFNHSSVYPLTGAHASVATNCTLCHKTGDVKAAPTNCNGCHNAAYQASKNPNHVTAKFSTDCASCHSTNPGWRPSTFNHNTIYPLTGAHATIASNCTACHLNGQFSNTPKDCNGCHNAAYQGSKNPNHVTGKFSTDCASCHTTNPGWRPSTFNHSSFYPLTGAHATIANNCTSCHKNGQFSNTPTDCNACHNAAFLASKSPPHASLGISTNCASCHTTNPSWRPSTFNHNTVYPLQGAHAAIATNCAACHKTGNISTAPTTCYGCHATNYNTATPNHATAGFPTDCATCHSQTAWKPSTFNHDAQYFPIYSGTHKNTWTKCNECHTTTGNFSTFNCLNCHKKTTTDNNHRQVKGYTYVSTACYTCHPTGRS